MIGHVFKSLCLGCASECGYNEIICGDCAANLPVVAERCRGCGHPLPVAAEHCKHCDDRKSGVGHYYSDYLYTGVLRKAVHSVKFGWRFRGAAQLGRLCAAEGVDFAVYDKVVPVPYHFFRRFVRFIQPVDLLAKQFMSQGVCISKDVLARPVYTDYQSRLSRKERLKNVKNAFSVLKDVKGMRILVIDDIMTTGATVTEVARALKRKGASQVDVYTLMAGVPR